MTTDTLSWERQLWEAGYTRIAGVDEVGRGALAGPLVAAAVVLPTTSIEILTGEMWSTVRDSKTMTHLRRTSSSIAIHASGAEVSITQIPNDEVDAIGIAAANRLAMERAVMNLAIEPDVLLIDAMTLDLDLPQIGVIDGDAQSLSIAAASIVAKVYRDSLMIEMDTIYPAYGFARHKGYGVASHVAALQACGPCPAHRRSFAPVLRAATIHGQH